MKKRLPVFLLLAQLCTTMLVLAVTIWFSGGISLDSVNYLRLSDHLLAGKGYVLNAFSYRGIFTDWPPLYASSIAAVAMLTGTSSLIASKLLTAIFVLSIFFLFWHTFRKNAWIAGLVMLTDSATMIFSYTCSEVPYIFFLMLFCISLFRFSISKNSAALIIVVLAAVFAFYARYIGIYLVIVLLITAFLLRMQKGMSVRLLAAAGSVAFFDALLLAYNFFATGQAAGPRNYAVESSGELFRQLLSAVREELVLFNFPGGFIPPSLEIYQLLLLGIAVLALLLLVVRKPRDPRWDLLTTLFLITGAGHFIAFTCIRWNVALHYFDSRFFAPSTILVLLGCATRIIAGIRDRGRVPVAGGLLLLLIIPYYTYTFLLNYSTVEKGGNRKLTESYAAQLEATSLKYRHVATGTTIAFGEEKLMLVRDDLPIIYPEKKPYVAVNETLEEFTARMNATCGEKWLINVCTEEEALWHHPSFLELPHAYPPGTLIAPAQ